MKFVQLKASFLGMAKLPFTRQLALLLGLTVCIALAIYIAMWFRTIGNLSPVWGVRGQFLGGIIALLALFGVLRPLLRHLAGSATVNQVADIVEGNLKQDQVTVFDEEIPHRSRAGDDELNLELVKAMVSQEPKRVAQLVKQWLAES